MTECWHGACTVFMMWVMFTGINDPTRQETSCTNVCMVHAGLSAGEQS